MKNLKVYVCVFVRFDAQGHILPRELVWEDGTRYRIDRVLDSRPAVAPRAGGQGERYEVEINGKLCYLFFERGDYPHGGIVGRWFVERKA